MEASGKTVRGSAKSGDQLLAPFAPFVLADAARVSVSRLCENRGSGLVST